MGLLYPQSTEDSMREISERRSDGVTEFNAQKQALMAARIRALEGCLRDIQQAISESDPSVLVLSAISNKITMVLGGGKWMI